MANATMKILRSIDRLVGRAMGVAQWLLLPLSASLFLQWPLREIVQRYSREANDLGQVLFAVYVSAALTAAMRAHTHLSTGVLADRYSQSTRGRLADAGYLLAAIPWSLFVLWTHFDTAWRSLVTGEAFPETFNPGYFVIKAAAWLMALLLLLQSLVEVGRLGAKRR
jgi:TRAP-type mannitol/chloroaromatic compound transport system permease small subunit